MNTRCLSLVTAVGALCGAQADVSAQSQMDLLKHWAPEVYHDVNTSNSLGRQYYSARDTLLAVNFDGDWYSGDNWNNSHFQVWEQGQLSDRETPPQVGAVYTALVETQKFYFLSYGFYHTGDARTSPPTATRTTGKGRISA